MNRQFQQRRLSHIVDERPSFELPQEEVEALRARLSRNLKLDRLAEHPEEGTDGDASKEFEAWKTSHPCLLKHFSQFKEKAEGKRVAVFLDYDGTLTPIVSDPDRAFMSEQMRSVVRSVAQLFPTAIISGRGREKVETFVKLPELFYAGSHGMDIAGPNVGGCVNDKLTFQPASKFEPLMDEIFSKLEDRVKGIPGAAVEHNKFCVSVHFRNCEPDSWQLVQEVVDGTLQEHPELRATRGRKVLEVRPQVDWDKGRALLHVLGALGLCEQADVLPLYIGDDRTDEDAFRVLKTPSRGIGILVSSKVKHTDAVYTLNDPVDVMRFLQMLVVWGRTTSSRWHGSQQCNGWRLSGTLQEARS